MLAVACTRDIVVTHKSAHGISTATTVAAKTKTAHSTSIVIKVPGVPSVLLAKIRSEICSCIRWYWQNATPRSVQAYEVVLYVPTTYTVEVGYRVVSMSVDWHSIGSCPIHVDLDIARLDGSYEVSSSKFAIENLKYSCQILLFAWDV